MFWGKYAGKDMRWIYENDNEHFRKIMKSKQVIALINAFNRVAKNGKYAGSRYWHIYKNEGRKYFEYIYEKLRDEPEAPPHFLEDLKIIIRFKQ